jgi:hypothetical protein
MGQPLVGWSETGLVRSTTGIRRFDCAFFIGSFDNPGREQRPSDHVSVTEPVRKPEVTVMPTPDHPADPLHVQALLRRWLAARIDAAGLHWLDHAREELLDGAVDRVFFAAYGNVARHVGDEDLALSDSERAEAVEARRGWDPGHWTTSEAARAFLLLSLDDSDPAAYRDVVTYLLKERTDLGGMIALCRSLPILPHPERHREWAVAVTRTERKALFEAVALNNPFPAEWFSEEEWNQMVVRAGFLGCPSNAIQGLEQRANLALTHMLKGSSA